MTIFDLDFRLRISMRNSLAGGCGTNACTDRMLPAEVDGAAGAGDKGFNAIA